MAFPHVGCQLVMQLLHGCSCIVMPANYKPQINAIANQEHHSNLVHELFFTIYAEDTPLCPLYCRESNFGALLESIVLTICCCLRPWESIYDVQHPLHVISAAACIVADVSLHTTVHAASPASYQLQHEAQQDLVTLRTSTSICASSTPQLSWPSCSCSRAPSSSSL